MTHMRSAFSRFIAASQNRRLVLPVAVFVFVGVFGLASQAHATGGPLTGIELVVANLVGAIAVLFGWAMTQFLLFMTQMLVAVAGYNGFATADAVNRGWVIVRDLTNMFFILVMLIIAFGTILGVEEYSYKRMLPRLLIMAVVINFSKVICGLIIDFSQVVMITFVNGFSAIAGGNFVRMFQVSGAWDLALIRGDDASFTWSTVGALVLGGVLMMVAAVAIFIMTLMLVGRIVMLWLLIVLSPLAFFLSAFPKGKAAEAYGKWWGMFGNYVVIGPFVAFFLWLSLAVAGSGDIADSMDIVRGGSTAGTSLFVSQLGEQQQFYSFVIAIALLMGGMTMSAQFGAMGGSMMGGAAQWFQQKGVNAIRKPVTGALGGAAKLAGQQARLAEANLAARTGIRIPGFGGYVQKWSAGTEKRIEDKIGQGRQIAVDRLRSGGAMGVALGTLGATDEVARRSGVFGLADAVAVRPFRAAWRAAKGEATGLDDADTYLRNANVAQTDADNARDKGKDAEGRKNMELDTIKAKQAELDNLEVPSLSDQQRKELRNVIEDRKAKGIITDENYDNIDSTLKKWDRGEAMSRTDIDVMERSGFSGRTFQDARKNIDAYDQLSAPARQAIAAAQGKVTGIDAEINQHGFDENEANARVAKWTQGAERARIKGFAPEVPKHSLDAASSVTMLDEALRTRNKDLVKALVQKIANDGNLDDALDLKKLGKGRDGMKKFAGALQSGGLSQQEAMTSLAQA